MTGCVNTKQRHQSNTARPIDQLSLLDRSILDRHLRERASADTTLRQCGKLTMARAFMLKVVEVLTEVGVAGVQFLMFREPSLVIEVAGGIDGHDGSVWRYTARLGWVAGSPLANWKNGEGEDGTLVTWAKSPSFRGNWGDMEPLQVAVPGSKHWLDMSAEEFAREVIAGRVEWMAAQGAKVGDRFCKISGAAG